MSYNIIPNIIFIVAVMGVILIILKHLPEAATLPDNTASTTMPEHRLQNKGLPVEFASKIKASLVFWGKRLWHFVLEAKGIKHQAQVGYRIKKMFNKKKVVDAKNTENVFAPLNNAQPVQQHVVKDEKYFLDAIQQDPKNLDNYAGLAKIYLDNKNYKEAKDIYEYLVKHDSGNANFYAKLGYVSYLTEDFNSSVSSYQFSLALDSSHPSRYYNLGLALRALNKNAEAKQAFQKALTLEPNNVKYKEVLEESGQTI